MKRLWHRLRRSHGPWTRESQNGTWGYSSWVCTCGERVTDSLWGDPNRWAR